MKILTAEAQRHREKDEEKDEEKDASKHSIFKMVL